jgi:hypothetical protein
MESRMRQINGSSASAGTVKPGRHTFLMAFGMVEGFAGKNSAFSR